MAKVQWVADYAVTVQELGGKRVEPDDVVTVPDERFEGYVPPEEHRSKDHPWVAIEAPAAPKKSAKSATTVKEN